MQVQKLIHCHVHSEEAKEVNYLDLVAEHKIPSTLQSFKDTDIRHSDRTSARLFISPPVHSAHVIMPCFPPF
jgi:hypothetical protein